LKWGSGESELAFGPYPESGKRSSGGRSFDVLTLIQHSKVIGSKLVLKPGKAVVIDDRYSVPGKRLLRVDAYHGDRE
jgi:hypothetical protein